MKSTEEIFIEYAATFGESEIEAKKCKYNWEMMIEFAEFYHNKMKGIKMNESQLDEYKQIAKPFWLYTEVGTIWVIKDGVLKPKEDPNSSGIKYNPTATELNEVFELISQ